MTAKQLKELKAYAAAFNVPLIHFRTGYFVHVVTINEQLYTDHEEAIAKLRSLNLVHQPNDSQMQLSSED